MWPKYIVMYVHGDKESAYEEGEKLGLSNEALQQFKYCGYEVGVKVKVNMDGSFEYIGLE